MNTSNTIQKIAEAICKFQGELQTLGKDSSGYGYKYTSLDYIVESIRPLLSKNGLAFVQVPSTPQLEFGIVVSLTTRIMHVSGEFIEDTMIMPIPSVGKANDAQTYGAALTYARRYALTAILGIVADEDTDGTVQNKPAQKQARPQTAPTQQQPPPPPIDEPQASRFTRPMQPDALRQAMAKKVTGDNGKKASDKQQKYAASCLSAITTGDDERYLLTRALFGVSSTSELTTKQASAIIDWIDYKKEGDDWVFSEDARTEAARIIAEQRKAEGQGELFPSAGNGAYSE